MAVFLDRDGVIVRPVIMNGKPYPPSSPEKLEILTGVLDALNKLRDAGFLLICVTNQPDVARGKISRKVVEAINEVLLKTLCIDEVLVCYHDDDDKCRCRKPLPGMLLDAAARFSINLRKSYMIGDRWRDTEAGQNAGCRTVFIEYGYDERKSSNPPDAEVGSLSEATDWILENMNKNGE